MATSTTKPHVPWTAAKLVPEALKHKLHVVEDPPLIQLFGRAKFVVMVVFGAAGWQQGVSFFSLHLSISVFSCYLFPFRPFACCLFPFAVAYCLLPYRFCLLVLGPSPGCFNSVSISQFNFSRVSQFCLNPFRFYLLGLRQFFCG
jgi:hypothetical protein